MPQRSAEFLKTQRLRFPPAADVPPAADAACVLCCCLQPLLLAVRTVLIRQLVSAWLPGWALDGERTLCWCQKMDRNCDSHGDPSSQQHPGCRQCTDVEEKQQRLYDDGGVHQTPAAVQGNSKRRRTRFQNKAAEPEAEASPRQSQRTRRRAFLRSRTRKEMFVREWSKLGSAIRRAAAVCLAASTGADEDEHELDLPYVQLDKVITRAVSREAFGPLYLVT